MAGPRKVRIFRDLKKSPNWYVEWRDVEGRRHCESCGPQREDAQQRAGQIREELRLQREQAKRRTHAPLPAGPRDAAPTSAPGAGSGVQLEGLLRCDQVEIPITLRLEVTAGLVTALRQILRRPDEE